MNSTRNIVSLALLSLSLLLPRLLMAKGEVTVINTHTETNSSTSYSANSENYTWQGEDLIIDSFEYNGTTYDYTVEADKVVIRRAGNAETTGERCALFAEATSQGSNTLKPSYPRLGTTDNCDMAAVMSGNVINRGALDIFDNITDGFDSAKNIERVDFIFTGGITAPIDPNELTQTGVTVTEKSGNNDVLIAAILSLDGNGDPASYGPAVRVYHNGAGSSTKYAYGMTNIIYPITFLSNEKNPPQGYVHSIAGTTERFGMVFVDMEALELSSGQTWYGFSYFSPDIGDNSPNSKGQITLNKDPVNYQSFPQDTDRSVEFGDADVYGGASGYFVKSSLKNISGTAYQDTNKNNVINTGESGVAKIEVVLYEDNNGNGTLQPSDTELASVDTDSTGKYSFIGLNNGNYLIVIDPNDSDTPVSYQLNQNSVTAITITNADSVNNNYPYTTNVSTLSINKIVTPSTAISGNHIVYSITVTNNSDEDATNVKAVDILSSAVSYVSDDSDGSYDQNTGLWNAGNISKGTSKKLNITVLVN